VTPSWQAVAVGIALFASMAGYAIFAGADFGGGIWDLLAGGTERGRRARDAIDASVTPVWEGNQVWIVLGLVLLWTGFPAAFGAITTALFVPLALSVLGILLRGIGFAFRHEAQRPAAKRLTGALFGSASLIAPFFLGTCVGAVTTGGVRAHPAGNVLGAWTSPTAVVTGLLFVAACAYIGGIFLVGDSHRRGDKELTPYFERRAIAAGLCTGALAGLNIFLLSTSATYVFDRLTGIALPLVVASVLSGSASFVLMMLRRQWLLRVLGAGSVALVIAGWGLAQYPWILPRTLPLAHGSATTGSLWAELAVVLMALVFVVPSFVYLYWLQQHGVLIHDSASPALRSAAHDQGAGGDHPGRGRPPGPRSGTLAVVAVAVALVLGWANARRTKRIGT
jgi:cytochrome d ubiquinol oxidase subunit II